MECYDVSKASRDELQFILSSAKDEIEFFEQRSKNVERYSKEIEETQNFIAIRKILLKRKQNETDSIGFRVILLAITVLWAPILYLFVRDDKYVLSEKYNEFLMLSTELKIFLGILVLLLIFLAIRGLWRIPKFRLDRIKTIKDVEIILQDAERKLPVLKKAKEEEEEQAKNGLKEVKKIPPDYCDYYILTEMLQYINKGRASNWERVTDLYEEAEYRRLMLENSQLTLEEAREQTRVAMQTRKATRLAAFGSLVSAAGIWRINSKL